MTLEEANTPLIKREIIDALDHIVASELALDSGRIPASRFIHYKEQMCVLIRAGRLERGIYGVNENRIGWFSKLKQGEE